MNAYANKVTHPVKALYEKVVVITRKTELEELTARFNTVSQAQFYLEHAGRDFMPIASAHEAYHQVLNNVRAMIPRALKHQVVERSFLPQFTFGEADMVITIGPDGLVVNTAKYLEAQPILPVNPDPQRIDGVLLPFNASNAEQALEHGLRNEQPIKQVTMAEARLNDGQTLLGFNDLFIGARTHVSARYEIAQAGKKELHSSSGIIVSTGAGSTGWLQSVYAGAARVIETLGGQVKPLVNQGRLPWDTDNLIYAVREPFPSKITGTSMTFGTISNSHPLTITSHMTDNGVIFSDGVEADYVQFNAGSTAIIGLSKRKAHILVS